MVERLAQLAPRIYNTPLLVDWQKAVIIEEVLWRWSAGETPKPEAALGGARAAEQRTYFVTDRGVAVVPVVGTLVHRGAWIGSYSGMTSYQGLARQFTEAARDDGVRGIVLDLDSGGGEAAGMFELARLIRQVDGEKPVWAVSNESMFSAAYGLGSAARRVLAPESALAGSIGVIAMHQDRSEKNKRDGVRYTPVFAGARKADMSPHAPLSDAARERLQAIVDSSYQQFVGLVAHHLGITEQAVRDTEADIFMTHEAQRIGLVHGVSTLGDAIAELEADVNRSSRIITPSRASARAATERTTTMDPKTETADKPEQSAITEADLQAARAEGYQEGLKTGAEQERVRVSGILEHPEAEGRTALAHKAVSTGLTVEQAADLLAASPKTAAQDLPDIATVPAANVGPGSATGEDDDDRAAAQAAVARYTRRPAVQ
ncbi:MAG: S49 family peptidase [Ectothiorhodospiraceae bacterium]|nr:S49 family peptidase [Ectothiorhodospiraceae bacterium]MCH8502912.1 S49 family peptidase [Ectothiorhodospiraceae bacterium]